VLGSVLRYATRYPSRVAHALTTDPLGIWETVRDRLVQAEEYSRGPCRYEPASNWEEKLHRELAVPWPCPSIPSFAKLWPQVVEGVRAAGIKVGPESFNGFNDGDAAFVRAVWCLIVHLKPCDVVETGVAHGFTSRFALEALAHNDRGHLSSIDRSPLDPTMRRRVGIAVSDRSRWTFVEGSSRRRLPALVARLGEIGLFVHDSLHTEQNLRFELDCAWSHLRPGGALVIDDLDTNWGFRSFVRDHPGHRTFVCEAEPVRPDLRRFNDKGLFGIILKNPTSASDRR